MAMLKPSEPTRRQLALIRELGGAVESVETFEQASALIDKLVAESRVEHYENRLHNMAKSGGGGFHSDSLGVANLGREAGLTEQQVFDDIRRHASGTRAVPDKEIRDTVRKAFADASFTPAPVARPVLADPFKTRHRYVERGRERIGSAAVDELEDGLRRLSPVAIAENPKEHGALFLSHAYRPDDVLFIGERYDGGQRHVRPVSAWVDEIRDGCRWPHFIVNPLTGKEGATKGGKMSYRADGCVSSYRYALAEFDKVPRDEQLAFWAGFPAPVAALIDSGGKSIHALLRVDCDSVETWERDVEQALFQRLLIPLGVDAACRNEARLSRMPGHLREEKKRFQRLIYLNPNPSTEGVGHE